MARMVVRRPEKGFGEETGKSYDKTSFLPVLRSVAKNTSQTSFVRAGEARRPCCQESVHTKENRAVNPTVFQGGAPLSFVCAQLSFSRSLLPFCTALDIVTQFWLKKTSRPSVYHSFMVAEL